MRFIILTTALLISAYAQAQVNIIAKGITRQKIIMKYFKDNSGLIATRTDADILTDGDITKVPLSQRINDRHRQNQLASGLNLNPYEINYSVIPEEKDIRKTLVTHGIQMRSIYYTIDLETGLSAFGIIADVGPGGQTTNGEFSIHQVQEMKLPVDKRTGTGGVDSNRLVTIIFPGSHTLIDPKNITQEKINSLGKDLLAKYEDSVGIENVIRDIKGSTMHVPKYD